jgi:hypothetical protein
MEFTATLWGFMSIASALVNPTAPNLLEQYNTITDRTESAYVAVLAVTPISSSVLDPHIYETDAKIEVELEREKGEDGGGKFKFKTRNKDGKVCFNPQSDIAGEHVCFNLFKDGKGKIRIAQGRIHRRNELFIEHVEL